MEELAGPAEDTSAFVRDWLESWEADQSINGHTVAARDKITGLIIDPWKAKDGFAEATRDEWEIDLANAPFRLLAIVNRIDMGGIVNVAGESVSFGNSGRAGYYDGTAPNGELRLVFAATDSEGEPLEGGFTAIFEYALPSVAFKKRLRSGRIPEKWGDGPVPRTDRFPEIAQRPQGGRQVCRPLACARCVRRIRLRIPCSAGGADRRIHRPPGRCRTHAIAVAHQ